MKGATVTADIPAAGPALLHVDRVNKRFGAVVAAADITLSIGRGECVSLIGSNGAGKTTLVNMVTGYLKPDDGRIAFDGRDVTALAPRTITRLGVARSFQIPQLYSSLSVLENMLIALGVVLRNAGRGGYFSRGGRRVMSRPWNSIVPRSGLR